jgi:elongation factor Ts
MKVQRFERAGGVLGAYCHHDGSVGVLVVAEGENADSQVLRDVAMHITARNPRATLREELPADVIAKEKEIATAQAMATGKPQQIAEKIAEGKLKTWFGENVLVEQPFVKDDKKTVGQYAKEHGMKILRYIHWELGK